MEYRNIVGMIKVPWDLSNYSHEENRRFLKDLVVFIFSREKPGRGGGDNASRYIYLAEETPDGKVILERPAHLKKGFDFLIRLKGYEFEKNKDNPKHDHIFEQVKKIINVNKDNKEVIEKAINKVYMCYDPEFILNEQEFKPLSVLKTTQSLLNVETILKILKWMFIEQDIRDWNYSGREMLYNYIMQAFQT